MHELIFDPFVQADGSITRKYGGTGLGLSITQKMVEMMHGSIGLESEPGHGSTFEVRLPLKVCQKQLENVNENSRRLLLKPGVKVLLVEDNLLNQEVLKRYLELNGCTVQVASNGREGVEVFSGADPHLVLMDLHMPVMDGLQATKEIRELKSGTVPIIMISADAFAEQREKAIKAGCNHYLTKPVDFKMFNKVILEFLPEFRPN
jgi:CheY-like chemotaxis protein